MRAHLVAERFRHRGKSAAKSAATVTPIRFGVEMITGISGANEGGRAAIFREKFSTWRETNGSMFDVHQRESRQPYCFVER